jgi:predicted AAA+ superfamily ATPase
MVEKRVLTDSNKEERKQLEIDFIANQGSNRYYIQSAFELPSIKKQAQEMESLINVRDSFKKLIIVKDYVKVKHDNNGITTMSIFDFLLDENSLNL